MNVNAQEVPRDTVLKEQKIEEVVMIGYGTAKKRDLTGSITRVSGEEVNDKLCIQSRTCHKVELLVCLL